MSKSGTLERALEVAEWPENYSNFELRVALQNLAAHYRETKRKLDAATQAARSAG